MKKYILTLILLVTLVLGGCTNPAEKQNSEVKVFNENDGLVSQGVIEAKEVSINSKIPGKIAKIHVEEGEEVEGGELLVEISSEELQAKKEQAQALIDAAQAAYNAAVGQVEAAKSQLNKAQNGARDQEIEQARIYYDLMKKTYDKVEKLYKKGAVSEQKKDEVEAQLRIAEQKLSMAEEGARNEDISGAQALVTQAMSMQQAAKGKLDQAKAGLQEVEAYLKDTKLVSPINGTITVINADEGELVSTGMSIATVTGLSNTWVEVKVDETDLGKISLGQKVKVKVLSYPDKEFEGKVVRINKKPDFATKKATSENGDLDIVAFGVKIEIDNTEKLLRPGTTAFVQFLQ